MNNFRLPGASLILALLLSFSAFNSAPAQLVNGDFEAGNLNAWTVTDPSGFTILGSNPLFAHTGSFYVNLGAFPGSGSLSQTFNTSAGQTYDLSFWLANDTISAINSFQVFWNGTPVFSQTNAPSSAYTNIAIGNLAATGPTSTIEFRHIHNDDFFRLDDVSLSIVPEPSAVSFALIGLGLLGALRHARSRSRI